MEITLPEPLREFVELKVSTGAYDSPSEFVSTLIRDAQMRDRERQEAENRLEALLLEGIDSGIPITVSEAYWEEKKAALRARRQTQKAA